MADSSFDSIQTGHAKARELRLAAREVRELAKDLVARARALRRRVQHLDSRIPKSTTPLQIKRQLTLRDEALEALKQSLHDLESVRMFKADDSSVSELKADIRKTIARAR